MGAFYESGRRVVGTGSNKTMWCVHVQVFVFTGGPPPNWLESHSWYAPVRVAPAEKMPVREIS